MTEYIDITIDTQSFVEPDLSKPRLSGGLAAVTAATRAAAAAAGLPHRPDAWGSVYAGRGAPFDAVVWVRVPEEHEDREQAPWLAFVELYGHPTADGGWLAPSWRELLREWEAAAAGSGPAAVELGAMLARTKLLVEVDDRRLEPVYEGRTYRLMCDLEDESWEAAVS